MPVGAKTRGLDDKVAARLRRRRLALDALRKQTKLAEDRLRWDIFNCWRTGEGSMENIAAASGYSLNWVWKLINRIKGNDRFLEMAIKEYLKDNPDATV